MARLFVFVIFASFGVVVFQSFRQSYEETVSEGQDATETVTVAEPDRSLAGQEEAAPPIVPEAAGQAVATTESIQATKRLFRLAFNHNPPRKIIEGNSVAGIDLDIMRAFAQKYDLELAIRTCALNECLNALKAGQADGVLGIARLPEREEFLSYLDPSIPIHVVKSFYQAKDSRTKIKDYADLKDQRVGVLKGQEYFARFDKDKRIKKKVYPTYEALVKALSKKQIDTFVGIEDPTDFIVTKQGQARNLEKANFQVRDVILVHFLTLAKNSPFHAEKEKMSELLGNMVLTGEVRKIVEQGTKAFRIALRNEN